MAAPAAAAAIRLIMLMVISNRVAKLGGWCERREYKRGKEDAIPEKLCNAYWGWLIDLDGGNIDLGVSVT
jgi:hypothetical protein